MNRRERLELKIKKREEWAAKAAAKSEQRFAAVDRICSNIPLGQPILVGHHSERGARADQKRIHGGMSKGCELAALAQHHEQKAARLERQLDHTIFSDDDNAIESIKQRIAEHEAQRDRMKQVNAAYRKGDAAALLALGLDMGQLREKIAARPVYLTRTVYQTYELTNLGARIRSDQKRIEQIRHQNSKRAQAEASGGVAMMVSGEYTVITFAEKPDREIIDALKTAGYWWSSGSWCGKTTDLPACVNGDNQHAQ